MAYPDDCIQTLVSGPWWEPDTTNQLCRGALVTCFIPYIDGTPLTLEPVARTTATVHGSATVKVGPLKVEAPIRQTALPVAAMTLQHNEVWAAYRAKRRPCLVLSTPCGRPHGSLTTGMPNHALAGTVIVAPFYGADQDGTRAGYNPALVQRIQHCEYPQYLWDQLPTTSGPQSSILRLDQMQPVGTHHHSYKLHNQRLSAGAMHIVDGMVHWLLHGTLPATHDIVGFKELMAETFDCS